MDNHLLFHDKEGNILPDSSQLCTLGTVTQYTPHDSCRFIGIDKDENFTYYHKVFNDETTRVVIDKQLPNLYEHRYECSGCSACFSICPRSGKNGKYSRKDDNGNILLFKFKFSANDHERYIEHSGAITMLPDEEGFLYPVIDAEICIRCHKCLDVCPFK